MFKNNLMITHKQLINPAYLWVLKYGSCGVAFKELNSLADNGEYPDVIGFGAWGHSVLVECKSSRSDFFADRKKYFRINPNEGMGSYRYYCCPTGLLKVEDLPPLWGLLYVNENFRTTCIKRLLRNEKQERNIRAEHGLMYSALRRLHIRGRIDEIYTLPTITNDNPET